jgi:DNA repair protein RecO (recombination protein O)
MEWKDTGLILGVRKHGETSAIIEVMTEHHGRHLGLVRGGRSSRMRPLLQPGNSVSLVWRARLEEHLGMFQAEAEELRAARLMETPLGIHGLQTLASHLRLLPERDSHQGLYRAALVMLDHFDEPQKAARLMIRFELALLEELGFGLDLERCASTGQQHDLAYVSPKSGRAVSRDAGAPWQDRMLVLPSFLQQGATLSAAAAGLQDQLQAGFVLTRYFLDRDVYLPRGIEAPETRDGFIRRILKSAMVEGNAAGELETGHGR